MSNKMKRIIALLVVLGLTAGITGCKLLHDKVIDVVLRNTCEMDFRTREDSGNYVGDPEVIDIAEDIDDALAAFDPPLERSDITDARMLSASYEVTWLEYPTSPEHDWTIKGEIWLRYGRAESVIVDYSGQSLYEADGAGEIVADLNPSGVSLFNEALEDFLDGDDPVLTFWVKGDECVPAPTASDSLKFDWTARVHMYVVSPFRLEVFDIFE